MPGPYDYTVNIPQPPAQNFLQSLSGIMQIRNMQDQAEIAKQAADIQKQQAQFAQQKQPLEIQQIQAGIAAQQASAAHSGAATGLLGVQTQAAKSALEESQRKNQAVASYQSEALKLAEDPTSWNATDLRKVAMKAAVLDPQSFSGLKNLFSELPQAGNILSNAASEVVLSVNAGKPDVALNSINQYLTASQAALDKNPNDKAASAAITFLQGAKTAVENDPAGAALSASNFLFNTDPKKFDATTNALKAAGEIGETQAKTKKALGESATGDVEIKDVFTKKLLKDSIDKAREYSQKAESALGILDKIDSGEVKLPTGLLGQAYQNYVADKYPMFANDITALKKDYIRINNSEAVKYLPKGSASDKDVKFAREGLMSEKANPEQFRKAVEAMARLNTLDATYQEAQAAWVSRNGNIGDARREISVLGDIVPKGTGFREWWKKSGSSLSSGQTLAPTQTDQITGAPDLTGGTINLGGGNTATFKLKK
jgi:hypothetical protein